MAGFARGQNYIYQVLKKVQLILHFLSSPLVCGQAEILRTEIGLGDHFPLKFFMTDFLMNSFTIFFYNFVEEFFDGIFDDFFRQFFSTSLLTNNLLTFASFRIGIPLIFIVPGVFNFAPRLGCTRKLC